MLVDRPLTSRPKEPKYIRTTKEFMGDVTIVAVDVTCLSRLQPLEAALVYFVVK